jgi:hypothetical protein
MPGRRRRGEEAPGRDRVTRRRRRPAAQAVRADRPLELLRHAITVSGVLGVAYFFSEAVAALAGETTAAETTAAEIAFRFLANIRLSEALAWLLGASGIGFGYLQRGLRERARREIEEEQRRSEGRRKSHPPQGDV